MSPARASSIACEASWKGSSDRSAPLVRATLAFFFAHVDMRNFWLNCLPYTVLRSMRGAAGNVAQLRVFGFSKSCAARIPQRRLSPVSSLDPCRRPLGSTELQMLQPGCQRSRLHFTATTAAGLNQLYSNCSHASTTRSGGRSLPPVTPPRNSRFVSAPRLYGWRLLTR